MSWDVLLLTQDPKDLGERRPPPLGDAEDVRMRISQSLAGVDWSSPEWGLLDGDGWSIEFNHQATGLSEALMLHVRGNGDPVAAIRKLCSDTGWMAFDTTEGDIIDFRASEVAGWRKFQNYVRNVTRRD